MTQGMFIRTERPRSKKALKEAVQRDPAHVFAEATSLFGSEFDGPITDMKIGQKVVFVGPNPSNNRKFYGTLTRTGENKFTVV